jgi:hypothetical protein
MSDIYYRTVVRFLIPAWDDPAVRPHPAQPRRDAIAAGAGDAGLWARVRSRVTSQGLVLASAGPEDASAVGEVINGVGRLLAAKHKGCAITVQQEPVRVEVTPDSLWGYRISRLVAAKPEPNSKTWASERAIAAGEPPTAWEAAVAQRLTDALAREAAIWGIELPETAGPLFTVLDAGRPMPVPGLPDDGMVLARLGLIIAAHARITGLLAAGKLARVGFGWLESVHLPKEIAPVSARRIASRIPDDVEVA